MVQVHWRIGGTYCLLLQVRRVSQASKQEETSKDQSSVSLRNVGNLLRDYTMSYSDMHKHVSITPFVVNV
jgi:hypothetical protein